MSSLLQDYFRSGLSLIFNLLLVSVADPFSVTLFLSPAPSLDHGLWGLSWDTELLGFQIPSIPITPHFYHQKDPGQADPAGEGIAEVIS